MDNEHLHKLQIKAWTMYDWANSAFATSVMGAILPNYFGLYIATEDSLALWGYTVAIGSLLAALLSPVLGAVADFRGSKKKFLGFFAGLGILSTALLFFIDKPEEWLLCCILYILGTLGFAGSLVFYDSLLPHVAHEDEIDQVSSRGYALGYIGGGLLLLVNVIMIFFGPKLTPNLGERGSTMLWMRLSLASVALWWSVFSIPLFRRVPEPSRMAEASEVGENVWKVSFSRFIQAFKDIRKFKDLFWFFLTFFVYANGIGTIITMAAVFATDLGFSTITILGTFLMVQFVAAPFSILFGFFMGQEWHFYLLGFGVAMVQGGSQALSRSLVGKLMPKSKSAEFYGFFSVFEKFNTVVGPAIMALVSQLTGNPRWGIVSLVVFFVAGILMLRRVDVERGVARAEEEDAKMIAVEA